MGGESFEMEWGGSVEMSLDETPAVGSLGKHVNLTSVFGQIVADLVRGKAAAWRRLPYLDRLPPYTANEPFRWLGVQAALRYYKLTDPKNP